MAVVSESSRRPTAFEVAYRDHSGAVYSVAQGLCGPGLAADVTKEVFLHLWSHPERYGQDRVSLRSSLLESTHSVAVDTIRSEARRSSDVERAQQLLDASDEAPPRRSTLDMLSGEERSAIVTVYYGGCNYREGARALGLDECTMKRRIREGLQSLGLEHAGPASTPTPEIDGGADRHGASATARGLAEALDARAAIAQAQGMIMEREGKSPTAAYTELLRLADRCGMTLPACAEVVITSARYRILDRAPVE